MSRSAAPQSEDWRHAPTPALSATLTAALSAFSGQGYHGTSVRDIAERADMTIPGLYYHHKNKERILFDLLNLSIDHLTARCEAALADAGGDPGWGFLNLAECHSLYTAQVPELARVDDELRSLSSDLRAAYVEKRSYLESMLVTQLERGIGVGLFGAQDTATTVRALFGMYHTIPSWFRVGGPRSAVEIAVAYRDISAYAARATPTLVERLT